MENVKHFVFDLTCDVTGDPEVKFLNFIWKISSRPLRCRLKFSVTSFGYRDRWGRYAPPPPPQQRAGVGLGPAGRGLIVVYTRVTRHNILVWSIDLTQHLFTLIRFNWWFNQIFKKYIDSCSHSSGYEKCDSIRFMIQAKIIWFLFDSRFKSESFTSLVWERLETRLR